MFQDADVIYSYTREQAIDDGVLVNVSETAKEAGIKYPTAVTRAVWCEIIEPDEKAKEHGESIAGRLWDVLFMFSMAARRSSGDIIQYRMLATKDGRQHTRTLKAVCSPGDTQAPVITIMLPDED